MTVLASFVDSINKSKSSFSIGAVSTPLVGNLESASSAWCFIPARWTTQKLKLDKRSRLCASWPELLNRFKIYVSES